MKTFLVGGAVRDIILGKQPKDHDYVVVGSSVDEMLSKGFVQVGKDFPVFLCPITGNEYALARVERKTGVGYTGFSVEFDSSVSLEMDLSRRDLTMNSIAMDNHMNIIDPFNGIQDIKNKIIRHTSDAFAEDPLRVLRAARFAARYQFEIHPDTVQMCKNLVQSGEIDHISSDRIWVEIEKILSEDNPQIAFKFLKDIGAFDCKKLKYLVIVDFDDRHDFSIMNTEEKAFFFIKNIFDNKIREASKIPLNFSRRISFMTDFKYVLQTFDIDSIIKVSDKHRNFIKANDHLRVMDFFMIDSNKRDILVDIFNGLNSLDFVLILDGIPKRDIPIVVKDTKTKLIKDLIKDDS